MPRKTRVLDKAEGNIAPGSEVVRYDPSKEEMYRKALPREVINFLEFDCAEKYAYVHVYGLYRRARSKEDLLRYLKRSSKAAMVRSFGQSHPCLIEAATL